MDDLSSTAISVLAAFVAILSALYARWQARAANRANEIALHESRLRVYCGLVRFSAHMSARSPASIKEDEVWKFAEVAELSEFYFAKAITLRLGTVLNNAITLLNMNQEWEETKASDEDRARTMVAPRYSLMKETRDECYAIGKDMKSHLRIGGS